MATRKRMRKIVPVKGLRSSWPTTQSPGDFAANAQNVRFRFGEARPNFGRRPFGGVRALAEDVQNFFTFSTIDDVLWSLMLQDTRLSTWGAANPGTPKQWTLQTGTASVGGEQWTSTAGEGQFFAAKGKDGIYKWSPGNNFELIVASDGGTVPIPRFVEYFNSRLVTAYNNETGITYANRIRWAQSGDYTKWDEAAFLGAGFVDLFEGMQEPITGFKRLRDRIIVYRPHSIGELIPTFDINTVFAYHTRITGTGTIFPYSIASTGETHFFLGTDYYVYAYDGTSLQRISDNVQDEIKELIYQEEAGNYSGEVILSQQEYWLMLNNEIEGRSDGFFIFDYMRGYWMRDTFPSLTDIAELVDTSPTDTWLTIQGIWLDWQITWNQLNGSTQFIIVGGRADGFTFQLDENIQWDYWTQGSIVDRFIETEDYVIGADDTFFSQGTVFRVVLEYEYRDATPFEFGYSIDLGANWTTQTVTPNTRGLSLVDFIATGPTVRFRFRENANAGNFRWRTYSFEFEDSGDWIGTT